MAKLTAVAVKNAKPGRHADGLGLYLLVKPSGSRSWLLRVQRDHHRRDIGLGSMSDLTLAEAREKAAQLRKVARNGGDPIAERDRDRQSIPTFKAAVTACHAEMKRGWTDKYAAAWLATLQDHAIPRLGARRVDSIDAGTIRDALAPIWIDKPVMARKVRQRLCAVLDFAHTKGWRAAEAPKASTVTMGLARQSKGKNFIALPYADVPDFLKAVGSEAETMGRMALMFTILTAARGGEVRAARWSHIDLDRAIWSRPAELMKSREAHEVTLNEPALAILRRAAELRTREGDGLIFPGKSGKPLSDMTLTKALRDAGHTVNVHGFRSTFRDWAAEKMPHIPDAVAEAALAHAVPDATIRAYKRTDFLEMRKTLLDAWGRFATGRSSEVIPFPAASPA